MKDYWKVARYVITNTRRKVLVLVNFQNKYYSVSYQIYILVSITAKQVTLISSDFLGC